MEPSLALDWLRRIGAVIRTSLGSWTPISGASDAPARNSQSTRPASADREERTPYTIDGVPLTTHSITDLTLSDKEPATSLGWCARCQDHTLHCQGQCLGCGL